MNWSKKKNKYKNSMRLKELKVFFFCENYHEF